MTERRKPVSPNQTFFFEQGGLVRLSTNIKSMPFGNLVENFLAERTLWKESRNGDWILYEPQTGKVIPFSREGMQLGISFDISEPKKEGKFSGAIVIFPLGLLSQDAQKAKNNLINASYFLKKEGTLFVLEAKYQDNNREWRKQIIKELGLVKGNVLVSQEGYLVWEARYHKEHKERAGVDLTNSQDVVRYERMRKLWKEMVEGYEARGYKVVGNEPLLTRLKNSKFIPQDIGYLKEGLGVSVEARCGCVWEVPLKNEWERKVHCPDLDCDGVPPSPATFYYPNEIKTIEARCFDCSDEGTQKNLSYRVEKIKPNGTVSLLEVTSCPHCGSGNSVQRHITVLKTQIKYR